MIIEDRLKLFAMSTQLIERDLDKVERILDCDFQRADEVDEKDEAYYPQFTEVIRREAAAMSRYYEIFYCLERSIRDLVREALLAEKGAIWWDNAIPEAIRSNAIKNMEKERDSGVTMRSEEGLDYTTFGELSQIVKANWDVFSDTFNSEKAFTKIMTSLNILRGPIAHCCPLSEDEVIRLRLTLRDWFRLME